MGALYSLILLSLFSSDCKFHMTFFYFTDSFFYFIKSAVDALCCIFLFIYCIHQFQNFCLVPFMILSHCFPDSFEFSFLCFLIGHWASIKLLFWILYQEKIIDLHYLRVHFWNIIVFFGSVMFLWFLMFLKVLHCCLHLWRSSHVL